MHRAQFSFEQRSPASSGRMIVKNQMFQWSKLFRYPSPARPPLPRVVPDEPPPPRCGVYQPLYKYLENRYATRVVLRLSEIEDILGFALPPSARTDQAWWTCADPTTPAGAYGRAWTSASRTAVPNFAARTVIFERRA